MNARRARHSLVRFAALTAACCLLVPAAGAWADVSGGTQRWSAAYDAGAPAFAYDVAVSPDGSTVFSTGTTNYGTTDPGHAATVAVDARTGATRWAAVYRSSSNPGQSDRGTRLAVSPDGSVVFVAADSACYSHCGGGGFLGYSTIAYNVSTGQRLWSSRYAETGPGAYSIAVSPDGATVFVNGGTDSGLENTTVAYDAVTGSELYTIPGADLMVPWSALAVSPDSSTVFVTATALPGQPTCGFEVAAYDAADGTPQWSSVYPDCSGESHVAMALSQDGSTVYAAGFGNAGFATVAFDASTGGQRWATVDSDLRVDGDIAPSVAAGPEGDRVFVLADSACKPICFGQPLVTVAYDAATGSRLWESRYDSGGANYPADLGVSADGSQVFATGQEQMPCFSPCRATQVNGPLVAYDAETGSEAWVADYEDNSAFALAVSPDGSNVYLGGTFTTAASASGVAAQSTSGCSASACGFSMTAYNAHHGPGISQDRDAPLRYDGWSTFFDGTALGGSYRASRTRGQTATFRTPVTRKLKWITHLGRQAGRARVLIDGRRKGTFDLYAPAGASHAFRFTGLPHRSHVVTIKVLGTKNPASGGRWVAVDGFNVKRAIREEYASGVRYGTWAGMSRRAASGGSYRESASPGAEVAFTFSGHRIAWVTATGPAYGRARVVVDGVAHTVDLYRAHRHWRVKIAYRGLGSGKHRIAIRPLGSKDPASSSARVVFDAFITH